MRSKLNANINLVAIACVARDEKKLANSALKELMDRDLANAKAEYKIRLNIYKANEREILMIQNAITPQVEAELTQQSMTEHKLHDNFQELRHPGKAWGEVSYTTSEPSVSHFDNDHTAAGMHDE